MCVLHSALYVWCTSHLYVVCVQDLLRPDFLSKPPEAMTEEEMKLAKEFEQKEADLLEERDKYKKVMDQLSL